MPFECPIFAFCGFAHRTCFGRLASYFSVKHFWWLVRLAKILMIFQPCAPGILPWACWRSARSGKRLCSFLGRTVCPAPGAFRMGYLAPKLVTHLRIIWDIGENDEYNGIWRYLAYAPALWNWWRCELSWENADLTNAHREEHGCFEKQQKWGLTNWS